MLAAVRGAIVAGLADAAAIDGLIVGLETTACDAIEWVPSPFLTNIIMRKTDKIH